MFVSWDFWSLYVIGQWRLDSKQGEREEEWDTGPTNQESNRDLVLQPSRDCPLTWTFALSHSAPLQNVRRLSRGQCTSESSVIVRTAMCTCNDLKLTPPTTYPVLVKNQRLLKNQLITAQPSVGCPVGLMSLTTCGQSSSMQRNQNRYTTNLTVSHCTCKTHRGQGTLGFHNT